MYGPHQSYHLINGIHPHAGMHFMTFYKTCSEAKELNEDINIFCYHSTSHYDNEFISVCNNNSIAFQIDWGFIEKVCNNVEANAEDKEDNRHPNAAAKDFGYCSSRSTSHLHSESGHAIPNFHKGT